MDSTFPLNFNDYLCLKKLDHINYRTNYLKKLCSTNNINEARMLPDPLL